MELAKEHLQTIVEFLNNIDDSLGKIASLHVPSEGVKRKASFSADASPDEGPSNKKQNTNQEMAGRESRAMEQLAAFITKLGGDKAQVAGFRSRVTKKGSGGFDINFYDSDGRRFRSMLQVGRHFGLAEAGQAPSIRRNPGNQKTDAQRQKLRRELDRLRKNLKTASKALDAKEDNREDATEAIVDDYFLRDSASPEASAGALIPDITGFPGVPQRCVPDVLMAWDFLCTFSRALSLTPVALDDFASALTYTPPEGQLGDDVVAPPVYVAEAHLGLLKLLLQDTYSEDWWWATLESPADELGGTVAVDKEHEGKPVIKVDMDVLLQEKEDPLITSSWLLALENVTAGKEGVVNTDAVKEAIKTALKLVSNKWVHAYLRKTLDGGKSNGPKFMTQAVMFLVKTIKQARPDLTDRNTRPDKLRKAMETVLEDVKQHIEALPSSALAVTNEDALSDIEYEDDSDDSDDEDESQKSDKKLKSTLPMDESEQISSAIPPRPPPSVVDLLLPPSKPDQNSEFLNAFTWSHIAGAAAHRVLHRKKRLLNEVDDFLRSSRELLGINEAERRIREKTAASRVLTECADIVEGVSPTDKAIAHLTSGGNYLQLSTCERLCVLRLLIEAAYDTNRVHEVVSGNIKQRTNAMKALEVEQRRSKREAKEKIASDDAAAREKLALEAKEKFLDEKREEIRKLSAKSAEFSDDVIDSLTEEDIVGFDEEFTADFDALPTSDSFNKLEVKKMVTRMQEEAAFDTHALRVLTMKQLLEREKRELEELEGQLLGFGGENALADPSLDRETIRSIERLRRDVNRAKEQLERLPVYRERAVEQLKDAMEDGTIKVLRAAVTAGKKAKLSGSDEETGGVWAVDCMRDAALELDLAKSNKRVQDAQRDLVMKRNKCFIRTEPMGLDRFGSRFWSFDADEDGHLWVDAEYRLNDILNTQAQQGFVNLARKSSDIACSARDNEEDLMGSSDGEDPDQFRHFSRKEYHSSGFSPTLTMNHWGCLATEESLRAVIKVLDSKGIRENELKTKLKESLEHTVGNDEKHEGTEAMVAKDEHAGVDEHAVDNGVVDPEGIEEMSAGDDEAFRAVKEGAIEKSKKLDNSSDIISPELLEKIHSAIGQNVRIRQIIAANGAKEPTVARYETGVVVGWKNRREEVEVTRDDNDMDDEDEDDDLFEEQLQVVFIASWKISTNRGHTLWIMGHELVESLCRYEKWKNGRGYFEDDAAFFAYRNNLGRFLGKSQEAPYSCSPNCFASLMVRREAELYSKLKIRSFDNNWGGKSGARALWTNSMKDYAFDFQTARQGLVTLENAFFDLTGEFADYEHLITETPDPKALLADPEKRHDVELETIEKVAGLWNSPSSRLVFLEIVNSCKTTGVLALALDLLCRNTLMYLQTHKLLKTKEELVSDMSPFYEDAISASSTFRRTRRANAWQSNQVNYEEFF
jgi:hypothetical protein